MGAVVRRSAIACAVIVLLGYATSVAQPKLESSSLGGWRGSWFSALDPTQHGPIRQFIDTERNRRVSGFVEWLQGIWQAPVFQMELQGTTSASCIFNYEMKGLGDAEGMRMTFHGMHEPALAMGGYMLFNPGLVDQGHVFMIQDFDGPGAPNVQGHYMGTFQSSVNREITGPFTFYVFDGRQGPAQVNGNFWGELDLTDPLMDRELEFYFAGRIDDKNHSLVVGDGDAGIFMVEMHYTPAMRNPDGEMQNAMFSGHYHVFLPDGSEDMGMFEVTHNPNFGQPPIDTIGH